MRLQKDGEAEIERERWGCGRGQGGGWDRLGDVVKVGYRNGDMVGDGNGDVFKDGCRDGDMVGTGTWFGKGTGMGTSFRMGT